MDFGLMIAQAAINSLGFGLAFIWSQLVIDLLRANHQRRLNREAMQELLDKAGVQLASQSGSIPPPPVPYEPKSLHILDTVDRLWLPEYEDALDKVLEQSRCCHLGAITGLICLNCGHQVGCPNYAPVCPV